MRKASKQIVILGSTGSIGRNTLDVVRSLGGNLKVLGLSARSNVEELAAQSLEFKPQVVALTDSRAAREFASRFPDLKVLSGEQSLVELASLPRADLVVVAVVGSAGILPSLAAIETGKDVALANKESLVAAGEIIVSAARSKGINLLPIDSEHSAIYQCLKGEKIEGVRRILLTASGGPLIDKEPGEIEATGIAEALRHPTWQMGKKVTIDSATLLNKGFEVIEAHWLFGLEPERIDVVVERNSIVHSLVEFVDGSMLALLSPPDMRLPIQFALTYPVRLRTKLESIDLTEIAGLRFEKPDFDKFPCLGLAYDVAKKGGTAPAVLSAADEVVVDAFLEGKISFGDIHRILREVVESHDIKPKGNLNEILKADRWARQKAKVIVDDIMKG